MILYLDEKGCVVAKDKAVYVLFGVPDWVDEDIREYGTRYCCYHTGIGERVKKWGAVGHVNCVGMGGARSFSTDAFPCIDGSGRAFVLNRDNVRVVKLPLVCIRRDPGGRFEYRVLEDRYWNLVEIAKRARCSGHCVLDMYGSVVVFGSDLYTVVDSWVKLMRSKIVSMVSVLV